MFCNVPSLSNDALSLLSFAPTYAHSISTLIAGAPLIRFRSDLYRLLLATIYIGLYGRVAIVHKRAIRVGAGSFNYPID